MSHNCFCSFLEFLERVQLHVVITMPAKAMHAHPTTTTATVLFVLCVITANALPFPIFQNVPYGMPGIICIASFLSFLLSLLLPPPPQKKDCNVSKVFLSLLHDYSSSLSVWEDPVLLASSLYRFQNPSMLCLKEAILKNNCWANGIMPSLFKDVLQEFSVFDKSVPKDCLTLGRFWLVLVSQECLQLSH